MIPMTTSISISTYLLRDPCVLPSDCSIDACLCVCLQVGVLMMANTKRINWAKIEEALPSFATIFMVPMTFNLLRGAIFGMTICR